MASGSKKKGSKSRSRKKTSLETYRKYHRHVEEEGFVCNGFPEFGYGFIRPMPNDLPNDSNKPHFAKVAIDHYNLQNNTKYEVVKVLKAYMQPVSGFLVFITFNAKENDKDAADTITFQAQLRVLVEDNVMFVRAKSPPNIHDTPSQGNVLNLEPNRSVCHDGVNL